VTSGSEIRSWKHSEPSIFLAQKIHSCINEGYSQGFPWVTGRRGFRGSRTESRAFGRGADNRSVSTEGELLDSCCDGFRKEMLPNTQSIKGIVAGEPAVS